MKCDERIRVGIESDGVLKTDSRFQFGMYPIAIIPLFAGDLARAASYAISGVDQGRFDGDGCRLRRDLLPAALCPVAADFTLTTFTRQALVS